MDGENDGLQAQGEVEQGLAGEPQEQGKGDEATQAQLGSAAELNAYKVALAERDAKICELEASIAEAAKTAEAADKLRAEMDELRAAGEAQRVEFELRLAGAKNIKAATALLADHSGDVSKLKDAEPWLFEADVPEPTGTTGLEPAGTAGGGEEAEMKRWRKIAGLED